VRVSGNTILLHHARKQRGGELCLTRMARAYMSLQALSGVAVERSLPSGENRSDKSPDTQAGARLTHPLYFVAG
jgi:hypothetical protein